MINKFRGRELGATVPDLVSNARAEGMEKTHTHNQKTMTKWQ